MPTTPPPPMNLGTALRTQTAPLPVYFTQEQRGLLNAELLDTFEDLERADALLSEAKSSHKLKAGHISDRQADLRRKLRAGYQTQDVVVAVHLDADDPDMVLIVRKDNGKLVRRRPATEGERQMPVPGVEPSRGPSESFLPGGRQLPAPGETSTTGDDGVIDGELIPTTPRTRGADAFKAWTEGAPDEDIENPHEAGTGDYAEFRAGWDEAEYAYEYSAGFKAFPAPQPTEGDSVPRTTGWADGWEAASSTRGQIPRAHVELATSLYVMDREQLHAFLDDLDDIATLRLLYGLVCKAVAGRKKATTLVKAIVEEVLRGG